MKYWIVIAVLTMQAALITAATVFHILQFFGWVQFAKDVDCSSGKGGGPAYVHGPVRVVGADIYDLDRDGDGVGCERG